MKAHYDPEADALAIKWGGDAPYGESDEVAPGVILDYDKDGNVIGVEVLDASKQIKQYPGSLLITPLDSLPK
jgi:uncharacterized protein YuzE